MLFRIICKNREKTQAYAEPVFDVVPVSSSLKKFFLSSAPVMYTDHDGHMWTCDRSEIIENPVVDRVFIPGKCYHIMIGGDQ